MGFADPEMADANESEMISVISNQQIYCQYSKKLKDSNRTQESDCMF